MFQNNGGSHGTIHDLSATEVGVDRYRVKVQILNNALLLQELVHCQGVAILIPLLQLADTGEGLGVGLRVGRAGHLVEGHDPLNREYFVDAFPHCWIVPQLKALQILWLMFQPLF